MKTKKNELEIFRAQIDIIDQAILELIGKRHNISTRIGFVKRHMKLKVFNPARERELLGRIKSSARNLNIDEKHAEELWMNLIRESRRIQKRGK